MGVVTFGIVLARYGLNLGAIAVQESVVYMHAAAFMLGLSYAFKHDDHVRVDVLYSRLPPRGRALVNLAGHLLLLLPLSATLLVLGTPYAIQAWRILEGSTEVGGIPALFLLKSLIPVSALLLFAQGSADSIRALKALRGPRAEREP